jgi:hypothetical protein
MAPLTERVPLAEIGARARDAQPGRVALAALTGLIIGIAWCIARALRLAWLTLAWIGTAGALGWESGVQRQARIPRADLESEVTRLRSEVQRLSGG